MSLLYKRKGSPFWYVTKTRESTKTVNRKLAEEFARKALTEHWRAESLGEQTRTWNDLVADWLDVKDGRASFEQDRMVIEKFSEQLKRHEIELLASITPDEIAYYGKTVKALHSASTANRHFTTLRAMLNRARAKGWIHKAPSIANYHTVKREPRWLTPEQLALISHHLPEWIADMFLVASQTGMRFSNVAGLRWDWISADGNTVIVPAIKTKSEETYTVPLSDLAQKIIQKRKDVRAQSPVELQMYVFVGVKRIRRGEYVPCAPVKSVRYWWEIAVEKSGVPYLNWHAATRHTFTSWHIQQGTPDRIVKEMGGWSSMRMLENYAHLSTAHLTKYANNLNGSEK
jgi:integrase